MQKHFRPEQHIPHSPAADAERPFGDVRIFWLCQGDTGQMLPGVVFGKDGSISEDANKKCQKTGDDQQSVGHRKGIHAVCKGAAEQKDRI